VERLADLVLIDFTWASPYTGDQPSVVTVELAPSGEGTRLRLVHERLPADQVGPHAGGWGSILDNLVAALAADRDGGAVP
jgi:uncharacterized protein YndB with AHSA1/START domain